MSVFKQNILGFSLIKDKILIIKPKTLWLEEKYLNIPNENTINVNNDIVYIRIDTVIKIINIDNWKIYEKGINADFVFFENEDIFFIGKLNYQLQETEVKYINNKNILWEKTFCDLISLYIFSDFLIVKFINNAGKFFCLNKNTGKTLWHFSVAELGRWIDMGEEREGKIFGPIVECAGVLIIGVSGERIIGLDKNTGKLLWKNQYPPSGAGHIVHNKKAYTLHNNFCKLDPLTGKETPLFPYYSVFEKYKADAYCIDIMTDTYYISVGRLDCVILLWDIATGEILWRHELYPSSKTGRRGITLKGDIQDPVQYNNGKLYILTSDKILHMFNVDEAVKKKVKF